MTKWWAFCIATLTIILKGWKIIKWCAIVRLTISALFGHLVCFYFWRSGLIILWWTSFSIKPFLSFGWCSGRERSQGTGIEPECPVPCPPPSSWYSHCCSENPGSLLWGMLGPCLLLTVATLTGFHHGLQVPGSSSHAQLTWMAPGCGSPTCGTIQLSPISWKPSEKDSR